MANAQLGCVVRRLRKLVGAPSSEQILDGQLLQRFTGQRDEEAFTLLVERHGGMVLGVCRSVLNQAQDAEDAFQATFLLLACKAATIRNRESVASWLYGVAYRLALKRKASAANGRIHETQSLERVHAGSMDDMTWRELRYVLHEELNRLPDKLREPMLLCYLEGKTRDEAAQQ